MLVLSRWLFISLSAHTHTHTGVDWGGRAVTKFLEPNKAVTQVRVGSPVKHDKHYVLQKAIAYSPPLCIYTEYSLSAKISFFQISVMKSEKSVSVVKQKRILKCAGLS